MAKKSSVKVRLVPEGKPDSPFFYYVKNGIISRDNRNTAVEAN